ncbi:MAG: isocitrate/isopropylmalate dehydrogenase family protein [Spirochaetaceae bacterium]|nr:isocitrate/isopropylmalate dehydrogenase family protein [Spirochaetaceae bacterium]
MSDSGPARVALLPGDGIGPEVTAQAARLLEAVGGIGLIELEVGWSAFERHGDALPDATRTALAGCAGALLGAVSSPSERVDGYRSPVVALRQEFDLYANLRPLRSAPVAGSVAGVDILVVRENTEGLYAGRERWEQRETVAVAERVISRRATERIARVAFRHAADRARARSDTARVTIVHKANVLRLTDGLFRETALAVAREFPDVAVDEQLVDSHLYRLIREPDSYDVILAPNLYGDIISDAGAALVGGLGLVAGANADGATLIAEPVHGSAPDLAGTGRANPIAACRAAAMLLDALGRSRPAAAIERAVQAVLAAGPHTPDLQGRATTATVGDAVLRRLEQELRAVPS